MDRILLLPSVDGPEYDQHLVIPEGLAVEEAETIVLSHLDAAKEKNDGDWTFADAMPGLEALGFAHASVFIGPQYDG